MKTNIPNCILLDYYLKDMSAGEAMKEIKQTSENMVLPVILFSAVQNCKVISAELQTYDYLEKPFDMYALLDKVKGAETFQITTAQSS